MIAVGSDRLFEAPRSVPVPGAGHGGCLVGPGSVVDDQPGKVAHGPGAAAKLITGPAAAGPV